MLPPDPSEPSSFEPPNLLAELADQATQKIRALQSGEELRLAQNLTLHQALNKIFKYLNLFTSHLNQIQPTISRRYDIDEHCAYNALQWTEGFADYRKQSLADNAYLDHVSLRIKLTNSTPVILKRRWYEVQNLKEHLHTQGLRARQEIETLVENKLPNEFFYAELTPDFQVHIQFQGNFTSHQIDMLCTNLDSFGTSAFTLQTNQITPQFLDDFGRFLMGRKVNLPLQLISTRYQPTHPKFR